ncbi:hypothetical protein A7K94_0221365, partial [Modestobacter sp. VKM Ac-2676]
MRGPYHYLVLEVTPSLLGVDPGALHAATASDELPSAPSASLLTGLLGQLPDQLPPDVGAPAPADGRRRHLAAGRPRELGDRCAGTHEELLERVLVFIEDRLADPGLSTDAT